MAIIPGYPDISKKLVFQKGNSLQGVAELP
jgi:hypothetical protein